MLAASAAASVAGVGWWIAKRQPRVETKSAPAAERPWQGIRWPADVRVSVVSGRWWMEKGWLLSNDAICILPVAREMPPAFDLRLRFRRLGGSSSIAVFFGTPRGMGVCTLDGRGMNLGGVQSVNETTLEDGGGFAMPLVNGRTYEWTIELRPARVRMWIDGDLKNERDIAGATLSVPDTWAWKPDTKTPALLLGSWNSPTRFESLEWRAAGGSA